MDSQARSPLFPTFTLHEPDFQASPGLAFVAPAGTPKSIIQQLYQDISRISAANVSRSACTSTLGLSRYDAA